MTVTSEVDGQRFVAGAGRSETTRGLFLRALPTDMIEGRRVTFRSASRDGIRR